MVRFKATAVSAMDMPDLECFVVVLAEDLYGIGARLELSRGSSFDEQDIELGQDTYCLSTESGTVCYGGVVSWGLTGSVLEIVLDARAVKRLDVTEGYVIEVEASQEVLHDLKDGLRRVFNELN